MARYSRLIPVSVGMTRAVWFAFLVSDLKHGGPIAGLDQDYAAAAQPIPTRAVTGAW